MDNTKTIIELFDYKFSIPYYQRGYKWEEQEVRELLDDLWEFYQTSVQGEFYCLQPIVLKKNSEKNFEVIDGQQRLTTIYLVLSYLIKNIEDEGYRSDFFELIYETREGSEFYLKNGEFKNGIDESSIDYYHMSTAYQTIDKWFKENSGTKNKLTTILLDKEDSHNKNVKVIWYEIGDENPVDAFIRLNVGKIPLTDGELIKALLLQTDKYKDNRQYFYRELDKIANEWDRIEQDLQREEVWYFLNNKEKEYATHIEFIFELLATKYFRNNEEINFAFEGKRPKKYAIFLIINKYLQLLKNDRKTDQDRLDVVKLFWEEVTLYYENFMQWFNNRKLFHLIGFLLAVNPTNFLIEELITKSKITDKDEFEKFLKEKIQKSLPQVKNIIDTNGVEHSSTLEELNYDENYLDILKILLLHNVIATLKSDKEMAKFPFHLYKQKKKKSDGWSLEHIHAQNTKDISDLKLQNLWLNDHRKLLEFRNYKGDFLQKIDSFLAGDSSLTFSDLRNEINNILNKGTDNIHDNINSIANLCLLDSATNSSLNNSVFEVKREKIKIRELKGYYIPICSRAVFLKSYTEFVRNQAYWDNEDRKAYINNIKITLDDFLPDHWKIKITENV